LWLLPASAGFSTGGMRELGFAIAFAVLATCTLTLMA
jgi:hypothetical protein